MFFPLAPIIHTSQAIVLPRGAGDHHHAVHSFYVVAIVILILHFTGVLARYNLEWLVLVLAVTVFPAVIYL